MEPTESKEDEEIGCRPHQGVSKSSKLDNYKLVRNIKKKVKKVPKRYGIADLISYALATADEVNREELINYKKAMSSKDM